MRIAVNLGVSILILAIGGLCLKLFGQKPEIETEPENRNPAALVETAEVASYDEPILIELDGEASTYRIITVGAEVTGKIVNKPDNVRGGNFVRTGDLLFQIDPLSYQLQVKQLSAQLEQIKAELQANDIDQANTSALISLAEEDWQLQKNLVARTKKLYERNGSTESALETAMKQEITSRNGVQSLKNQLRTLVQAKITKEANQKLIQAQLEQAEVDLKRCRVESPIDGRLVDDIIEQGDYVRPGDPLVHISDSSKMEIKCQMLSEELAWVWQQQIASMNQQGVELDEKDPIKLIAPVPCEVVFEFEGIETIWDGFLDRYEGTGIDRETRTFPCRVVVPHPTKTRTSSSQGGRTGVRPPVLLSGMYVTVRIPVESSVELLQIPIESVRPGGTVWTAHENTLHIVDVSLARTIDDIALIRRGDGIQPGDKVIISPLASVAGNMAVREAEETAAESQP